MEEPRRFLDAIGTKIGVQGDDLSPWYKTDYKALLRLGCGPLLRKRYKSSFYSMLKTVYSEHKWIPWKFKKIPKVVLGKDSEMVIDALTFVETEKKLRKPEDWYSVSTFQLRDLGVSALITQFGGLYKALRAYKPDYPWIAEKFIGMGQFSRKALGSSLKRLFPNKEILEKYDIGHRRAVSYFIPDLKIAFDFQSVRDFGLDRVSGLGEPVFHVERPIILEGITIIPIPFWWDRSLDSLIASILSVDATLREKMNLTDISEERLQEAQGIPSSYATRLSSFSKR